MKKKIIHRDDGSPYLIRWYLFRCSRFQICLHHILLSDYDCLHDHPWAFWSFILWGGYWERVPLHPTIFAEASQKGRDRFKRLYGVDGMAQKKKWYSPFSFLKREMYWRHALELPPGKTAWSLLIMFKKEREWGFWTTTGWEHYKTYDSTQSCE
jgi:hypothetical protein